MANVQMAFKAMAAQSDQAKPTQQATEWPELMDLCRPKIEIVPDVRFLIDVLRGIIIGLQNCQRNTYV